MAKKKGKVSSPKYDPKEEAASRKKHPTAGGKSSIDPQATIYITAAEIPVDIEATWAHALTDVAILNVFSRFVQDPTGWKKAQKRALLSEMVTRFQTLLEFEALIQSFADRYADALRARENGNLAQDAFVKSVCATLEYYNHPGQPQYVIAE